MKGFIQVDLDASNKGNEAKGKAPKAIPSSLKFSVPVIQRPKNPDEDLG